MKPQGRHFPWQSGRPRALGSVGSQLQTDRGLGFVGPLPLDGRRTGMGRGGGGLGGKEASPQGTRAPRAAGSPPRAALTAGPGLGRAEPGLVPSRPAGFLLWRESTEGLCPPQPGGKPPDHPAGRAARREEGAETHAGTQLLAAGRGLCADLAECPSFRCETETTAWHLRSSHSAEEAGSGLRTTRPGPSWAPTRLGAATLFTAELDWSSRWPRWGLLFKPLLASLRIQLRPPGHSAPGPGN